MPREAKDESDVTLLELVQHTGDEIGRALKNASHDCIEELTDARSALAALERKLQAEENADGS